MPPLAIVDYGFVVGANALAGYALARMAEAYGMFFVAFTRVMVTLAYQSGFKASKYARLILWRLLVLSTVLLQASLLLLGIWAFRPIMRGHSAKEPGNGESAMVISE